MAKKSPGDGTEWATINEPQHKRLEVVREHGQKYVTCLNCGRQWGIHGSTAEVVSEGDGYCDDAFQSNPGTSELRLSDSDDPMDVDYRQMLRRDLAKVQKERRWSDETLLNLIVDYIPTTLFARLTVQMERDFSGPRPTKRRK